MFLCVLILFQNASSQHRSRLFSRYKAVSITDKQTIHKTDNPRSKKKKGGKLKCRHQSLSKAIILGYTHHALSVCLSVCVSVSVCVSLSPPPPPSSAHSQGSLVICVVWMQNKRRERNNRGRRKNRRRNRWVGWGSGGAGAGVGVGVAEEN